MFSIREILKSPELEESGPLGINFVARRVQAELDRRRSLEAGHTTENGGAILPLGRTDRAIHDRANQTYSKKRGKK